MKDDYFWCGFMVLWLLLLFASCASVAKEIGVVTYYGNTTLTMYDPQDKRIVLVHVSNDGGL